MSRVLKPDMPGRDFRVAPETVQDLGWEAVFAPDLSPPLELVVDIGFGRGEFLMDLALRSPEVAHVGIERSYKRIHKMARRVAKTQLGNLRIIEGFAQVIVSEVFAEASVSTFWMNFPDPWPKDRHANRRLVRSDLVRDCAECLVRGGHLCFATDDIPYAEQAAGVLADECLLENVYAPEAFVHEVPGRSPTAFEREWRAKGKRLHFFSYRKKAFAADSSSASEPLTRPRQGLHPDESGVRAIGDS
jgi:tRNA (guanine-N7-)-methyltransferase